MAIVLGLVPVAAVAAWSLLQAGSPTQSPAVAGAPATASNTAAPRGPTAPDTAAPRRLTVAVSGDVLPHGPVLAAARRGRGYDFRPLLAGIRSPISHADLALCHLEVPLTDPPHIGFPSFRSPPQLAAALAWTGFDGCSTASNHAMDAGADGVASTLRALDAAGVRHAGTARGPREARRITVHDVDGVTVAHLSYTYGLNGITLPASQRWTVDLIDPAVIAADARRARQNGADLVLVSMHWGTEFVATPTAAQRTLARRLLASPAVDALIGHHAHVVQPVRRQRGKAVVFGLGNLLSNQAPGATSNCCPPETQDGVIVRLTFAERPDGSWSVATADHLPTFVTHPGRRVVLADDAGGAPSDQRTAALRRSAARTRHAVGPGAPPARSGTFAP